MSTHVDGVDAPLMNKEELVTSLKQLDDPINIEQLTNVLGSTVKQDNDNKAITFLSMLLTYTAEDQINLAYLAESSTGKSYIPLELAWYFPKEDVVEHGYVSPTAFFHEYGEYDKETHTITVNLERKILIYLDQPHDELLKRLRPLLSHDRKEILLKITDRREKSGTRTKNVKLIGFSTNVYCSVRYNLDDQDKTRQLLLSPEVTQEKIREAIQLRLKKEANRQTYEKTMTEDPERNHLANRVRAIKNADIDYINIPDELRAKIETRFLQEHKNLQSRQTRDITRLLAIIKGHGLLNYMHRPREENAITVNQEDVEIGFKLYSEISEANEMGIPPELHKVYTDMKPQFDEFENGFLKVDFQKLYYQKYRKYLGRKGDAMLKALVEVGLVNEEPDGADKRRWRYNTNGVWVTQSSTTTNNECKNKKPSVPTPPLCYSCSCPNCLALGKELYFNSQEDLDQHILAVHFIKVEGDS